VTARGATAAGLTLVGASAGSGKTYRLTQEVTQAIAPGAAAAAAAQPTSSPAIDLEGLVAVTYTKRAAGELAERLRRTLVETGAFDRAQRLPLAYLGTVHAVSLRLLQELAIDAGLSPHIDVAPGSEARLLRQALERALDPELRHRVETLARSLQVRRDNLRGRYDWLTPVDDVMTLARNNRIAPDALPSMAERSCAGLLALLGTARADGDAMDRELVAALERTHGLLGEIDDGLVKTTDARALVREALREAAAGPLCWSEWVRLSKVCPGKSAKGAVADLVAIASRADAHPRLHDEIREFTRAIYEAARLGLKAYDEEKRRRRVVDYVDMIDRTLALLENETAARELAPRLKLVVVDEFQDTSPLQLALFTRLHGIAGRSTWVGDRKQCIFEFAGADPSLMEAVTAWSAAEGGVSEQLPSNYRSRPELVTACSRLFVAAFARHGYTAEEVEVTARRQPPPALAELPPLGVWALESTREEDDAHAIAGGVARMLATPGETPVEDRATKAVRGVRPGDIAVLVSTNAAAGQLAQALALRGVRATVARTGLLSTPEGTMVQAALRALVDPRDVLSPAILEALTGFDGKTPEAWLEARLWRVAEDRAARAASGEGPSPEARPVEARASLPAPAPLSEIARRIATIRAALEGASPTEALDRVLSALDVAAIACRWPDPEQRLSNLDALRAMAAAYEERCAQDCATASIAGLLGYFDEAAEVVLVRDEEKAFDDQHVGTTDAGVTVLTYHRAKGLEWPVVVLGSLDKKERRTPFDVAPESDRPAFEPRDPLGGRWIRYWPWPYGSQQKTRLADVAEASAVGRAVSAREDKERVRLLYVGFTRARDHLVLAVREDGKGQRKTAWLDTLSDESGAALVALPIADGSTRSARVVLRGASVASKGKIDSFEVPARVWRLAPGDGSPERLDAHDGSAWFARPAAEGCPDAAAPRRPYRIAPSRAAAEWREIVEKVAGAGASGFGEPVSIGERLPLGKTTGVSWNAVGDAVHAFLAADVPELTREGRLVRAERLLAAAGVVAVLRPESLVRAGDQLRAWVDAAWPGATWHREVPVSAMLAPDGEVARRHAGPAGRRVVGTVDLLLMTGDGAVIVDHKSYPGERSTWSAKARAFAPQMAAYAHVLGAAGLEVVGQWVHFTVGAGVVRVG
jgi:ATP-dependent helicase/nuclease subunit A